MKILSRKNSKHKIENFSVTFKNHEFTQNHQNSVILVCGCHFAGSWNCQKPLILFERARAEDFPMYHDFYLKLNSGKTGIGSKLEQSMENL